MASPITGPSLPGLQSVLGGGLKSFQNCEMSAWRQALLQLAIGLSLFHLSTWDPREIVVSRDHCLSRLIAKGGSQVSV